MTAPTPRPTREQVDSDLAYADDWRGSDPHMDRLAAEVRALRAELERVHSALHHETAAHVAERARLRAALAARTPQPVPHGADPTNEGHR